MDSKRIHTKIKYIIPMKPSILFSSAGRRGRLLRNAQESIGSKCDINATDNNATAPALYFATNEYVVPRINDPEYVDTVLDICKKANVKAITTLIDPEIEILSANREKFLEAVLQMRLLLVVVLTNMRCSNISQRKVFLLR